MTYKRKLFVFHEIATQVDTQLITYFCLERLQDGLFTVLQISIFRPPFQKTEIEMARISFSEVFSEMDETQFPWANSLDEAITRHDADFGN